MPRWTMRRGEERGAAAVLVALSSALLVLFAAFAVDLGVQRVLRRDLQAMADVIAIDMARHLDGSTHAVIKARETWRGQLEDSVERNLNESPAPDVQAQQWQETATLTAVGAPDLLVTAVMGFIDDTGEFDPVEWPQDNTAIPEAVQVTVTNAREFVFSGLTGIDKGGATRSAVGQATPTACFKVGTFALGLATNDSALNGLLGDALGIGVLGYDGLATSSVSLLGLAAELGVGTPEEVLNLSNLSLGELIQASADALAETSPGSANVALLNDIKAQLDLAGLSGQVIDLGELVDLGTGRSSGLDAELNLLDLISGAAFLANGTNAIAVPGLTLAVPGLANLTVSLEVIQAPRMACGNGVARTGQFRLTIDGDLAVGVCPSGLLSLVLKLCISGPVAITLGLAEAEGRLASVSCTDGVAESIGVTISSQALATTTIALGSPDPLALKAGLLGLGLVNLDLVNLVADVTQADTSGTYVLDPWQDFVDTPYHTPQTPASVPNLTVTDLEVAGLNVGSLLSPALGLLNPVIAGVNTLISSTLSPALGLTVAGVDIWSVADPPPSCAQPALVG